MIEYFNIVNKVLKYGERRQNRTGIDTLSIFGYMFQHDLSLGFPLLTSKKMNLDIIAGELRWFLDGKTNPSELNSSIWDEWQSKNEIGPMYGSIWRDYKLPDGESIDQIANLIDLLKKNPNSRRHVMTTLHLGFVPDESYSPQDNVRRGKGCLWPCHGLITQCNVRNGKYLDLMMYQRSADTALGVPYNIASYALLTHIIANEVDLKVGKLNIVFGDLHIYENHIENIKEQIKLSDHGLPFLRNKPKLDFKLDELILEGYHPHPKIKYEIAV